MHRLWVRILLVTMVVQYADGKRKRIWGSRIKHKACVEGAKIRHGDLPRPKFHKDNAYYHIGGRDVSCEAAYTMNLQNVRSMSFRCTKGIWNGYDYLGVEVEDFTLKNITCKKNTPCGPIKPVDNGYHVVTTRFCLPLTNISSCDGTFYSGDKVTYGCKKGYRQRSNKENVGDYGVYEADVYDNYGDDNINVEETSNLEFKCDNRGQWMNEQNDMLPLCDKIVCNASHFENISNGYIKNFTESYEYGDILELVCDEGYNPINKRRLAQCLDSETFPTEEEFGCKRTKCPSPVPPIGGSVHYLNRSRNVGDIIMFSCDFDMKLTGPKTRTCLESGEWSTDVCVRCIPKDADCPPPCMQDDNILLTAHPTFSHGSVIEMTCRNNQDLIVNRTCLTNNRWDNSELHCKGKSDPLKALSVADSLQKAMNSLQNHTFIDVDGIQEKTIDVGVAGGVDVYFALDVSGSIDIAEFNMLKAFTLALTRNINISDRADGTRLAIYSFASETSILYNGHSTEVGDRRFNDIDTALNHLDELLNLADIREGAVQGMRIGRPGLGTNIRSVITDVMIDVNTKRAAQQRTPQQVLVIISDGDVTTSGDPTEEAQRLKDMDVQIYSIYVGIDVDRIKSKQCKQLMQALASDLPGEEHYFEIDEENFEETIKEMVGSPPIPCGLGDPYKTNISNNSVRKVQKMIAAIDHAWPWMVQIKSKDEHICGGSLIDKQHILTAAHCFVGQEGPFTFLLKSHTTEDDSRFIVHEKVEFRRSIKIHENFNQSVKPRMLYDIAIITLPVPIESYDYGMRAICLPDDDSVFDSIRPNKTYGVVTGWGGRDQLHQSQMVIPDEDTCMRSIPKRRREEFNTTLMMCAGGEDDDGETVDSCRGDSGGPFVVEALGKENTFVQIGIVSFGVGRCKQKGRYGFYTKLNKELVEWIHQTIRNEEDQVS